MCVFMTCLLIINHTSCADMAYKSSVIGTHTVQEQSAPALFLLQHGSEM